MKIVIPMAGTGQRFVQAGYTDPKPLIKVRDPDGLRTMLEHVLAMFLPFDDFVFICDARHLEQTQMRQCILHYVPKAKIVSIPPHTNGPVWTVKAAYEHIKDEEEVIVSYCDGTVRWNRDNFFNGVVRQRLDGCLFTHSGFHPHTLNSTKLAFMKVNEEGLVTEIKEKSSYTNDPLSEHASSGIYYFNKGAHIKQYFDQCLDEGIQHNGEYYVTLVYNPMIADGLRVGYYDTTGTAILGTPEEVRNFEAWATILQGHQVRNEQDLVRCYRYWRNYHDKT